MFTTETASAAGRQSGRSRRRGTAERLADDALDLLVRRVAAERPPLTAQQRRLLQTLLADDLATTPTVRGDQT